MPKHSYKTIFLFLSFFIYISGFTQTKLNFTIKTDLQESFGDEGMIMLYITTDGINEPMWISPNSEGCWLFTTKVGDWNKDEPLELDEIPFDRYFIQAVWDEDRVENPSKRNSIGMPVFSVKKEISTENAKVFLDSYVTSREQ